MATPGKPRQSNIPAPGKSGIPTPGRSRSVSSVLQSTQSNDTNDMSRALADAIKANDPAQHRASQTQPSSPYIIQSGRRSVAERQNVIQPPERSKTPVAARHISRPPSRHSDVQARSGNKHFEIGDNVRIDSLALEGTLRYIGEIEGKNGLWAGVELSGQFAGKGKNNGSVNEVQYFSCPDNCGVFVSTTKLSPGRLYQHTAPRPSSVASLRNGRITPSFSGHNTPSLSTSRLPSVSLSSGRITPSSSSGRVTPAITPTAKSNYLSKSTTGQNGESKPLPEKLTPGSRAAKYANMTAKQLSSRKEQAASPIRQVGEHTSHIPSSPSPISRTLSSPSRPPGSPFSTPKPGLNGRISATGQSLPSSRIHITPRGRVPSAVAMPPPASPISAFPRLTSLNKSSLEDLSLMNLDPRGGTPQDRTTLFTREGKTTNNASDRPDSVGSHPLPPDDRIVELQARIEELQSENEQFRSEKKARDEDERLTTIQKLEEDLKKSTEDNIRLAADKDELSKVHQTTLTNLQELQELQNTRQQRMDELESQIAHQLDESQQNIDALNAELAKVGSTRLELEEENQILRGSKVDLAAQIEELGAQVDELRLAGQETIALYEEKLSAADSQRYELEHRIVTLEKGATNQEPSSPHGSMPRSATEIDNEALRDQVTYLQKKIATMEDLIEDSRVANEREEISLRERMKRLKDKEDSMKLELSEGQREVERMSKAEASARSRVEEIEEALRESQVALENARAEIESLRAEFGNVVGLQNSSKRTEQPVTEKQRDHLMTENLRLLNQNNELLAQIATLTEANETETKRVDRDIALLTTNSRGAPGSPSKFELSTAREEITGLKHIIQDLQKEHSTTAQKIKLLESENQILVSETQLLRSEAQHLRQEVQVLEGNLDIETTNDNPEVAVTSQDAETVQRLPKEQKSRHEVDAEQLQKQLTETEMKYARTIHDLNKEISELEALVESKIYREDELEQEVERLKEKLSKTKKSTKNDVEGGTLRHQTSSASVRSTSTEDVHLSNESVCEICERPGHDIFNCDLLKEEVPTSLTNTHSSEDVFCSDCEMRGHTSADCPHSQDVF